MKAYKGKGPKEGQTLLFRPEANAKRMNSSMARLCFPVCIFIFEKLIFNRLLKRKNFCHVLPNSLKWIKIGFQGQRDIPCT